MHRVSSSKGAESVERFIYTQKVKKLTYTLTHHRENNNSNNNLKIIEDFSINSLIVIVVWFFNFILFFLKILELLSDAGYWKNEFSLKWSIFLCSLASKWGKEQTGGRSILFWNYCQLVMAVEKRVEWLHNYSLHYTAFNIC